ncbi:MAG: glycosyltransferase, partial [Chloroflexi bacterium]|nr:glycosyltransferase [Chloroflexota bacterium]
NKGGTYWRALYLAQSLVKCGHQVTVLATSPQRRWGYHHFTEAGVTIVAAPDLLPGPLRSGWDPWNVLARIKWLRGQEYDVVHAFEARPIVLLPALYAQRFGRARLVMDWCDWFGVGGSVEERPNPLIRTVLRPVETFFEERFRRQADGSTVINTVLQQRLQALGVPSETLMLLRNGSNTATFFPQAQATLRQRLGIPADTLLVGYVGAIFVRDAALMAEAFNALQVAEPRARLLLVGFTHAGLEPLLADPAKVIRIGSMPRSLVNDWLATCDVLWLPLCDSGANRGRTPLKLNDYLALGRPIVSTAVGDLVDFFDRYPVGWLAQPTPEALAAQTLAALHDPAGRAERGASARQMAEQVLNWDIIAAGLANFYKQILHSRQFPMVCQPQ